MPYRSFAEYLKNKYGTRVQKISVNGGFTCPNRNGTKGRGGCIYCDNSSFSPDYVLKSNSIAEQINEGINYFSAKYPTQKYIVYFQNYSNTYAPVDTLRKKYYEAINREDVIGISVATRPDCISYEILNLLTEINKKKEVFIEIGAETTNDNVLKFINRCHTFNDVIEACNAISKYKLWITLHLIIGLPFDDYKKVKERTDIINKLPINAVKFHQLQIIEGTELARLYYENKIKPDLLSLNEYINIMVEYIAHLRPDIYIERFTSEVNPDKLIAPKWNKIKNYQVVELIKKKLKELNLYQGCWYK